jgi:peroxin-5
VRRTCRDNDHAEAWRMLGVCHAENDEDKKAIVCLRRAVEADPYNVDAQLALGTSYVNELDSVRALEALRSWVTHNPLFQVRSIHCLPLRGGVPFNTYNTLCACTPCSPVQGVRIEADAYSDGSLMDEVVHLMLTVAAQVRTCLRPTAYGVHACCGSHL